MKHTHLGAVLLGALCAVSAPFSVFGFESRHALVLDQQVSQSAFHGDATQLSPTGPITIESWIKLNTLPSEGEVMGIVSKWTTENCCRRSYNMGIVGYQGNIDVYAQISRDGSASPGEYLAIEFPAQLLVNTWHHIAFVYQPGLRAEIFVDGVSIGFSSTGVPTALLDNEASFYVGATIDENGPANFFDGAIDEVRLWGVARTWGEISTTKDSELFTLEPALLGYWKLNGNGDDETAHGNHLTFNGNPGFVFESFNHAPVLSAIGNQIVAEGESLIFSVSAFDEDSDVLTYEASHLPLGASFDASTQTFSWTPSFDQSGSYVDVEFLVMDDGVPLELDMEHITITVGDTNRPPEISPLPAVSVLETEITSFVVTAGDPDGHAVTISAQTLPSGATFDGSQFHWVPTLADAGVHVVTFMASDNQTPSLTSVTEVVIVVGDNPTPIEQTDVIIDVVVNLDTSHSIINSYMAHLKKVEQYILDGKIQVALQQLQAVLHKLDQDCTQGVLTQLQYSGLRGKVLQLMSDLQG